MDSSPVIQGLSFDELWERSQVFRRIFMYRKLIRTRKDRALAESYWAARYPRTEWSFCNIEGCQRLVSAGGVCDAHRSHLGVLPQFKWAQGHLYVKTPVGKAVSLSEDMRQETYTRYDIKTWTDNIGILPAKYILRYIDDNPLNGHHRNLVALSPVSAAAYDAGVLDMGTAIALDQSIPDQIIQKACGERREHFWHYSCSKIAEDLGLSLHSLKRAVRNGELDPASLASIIRYYRKKQTSWSYTYADIARVAEANRHAVHQAAHRGACDPSDLGSVLAFCNDHSCGGPKAASWIYTIDDIAKAAGISTDNARRAVRRHRVDPCSLPSVVNYCISKQRGEKDERYSQTGT